MPLYDYACDQCEAHFEARHGFNDEAPPCPKCGASRVHKVILSAPSMPKGILAEVGTRGKATKEQLQAKWAEETPKLREKLVKKLGEETVNKHAPTLNTKYD
jgi:putative FmdB family regulatory protein